MYIMLSVGLIDFEALNVISVLNYYENILKTITDVTMVYIHSTLV